MNDSQASKAVQSMEKYFFRASAADFEKVPGAPIAYWQSEAVRAAFISCSLLSDEFTVAVGLQTSDNDRFVRYWHEVSLANFSCPSRNIANNAKWFAFNKGGEYRKWFGNAEYVVNWKDDGLEIKSFKDINGKLKSRPQNTDYYFCSHVSWSKISSGKFNVRFFHKGYIFADAGISAFSKGKHREECLSACLNSTVIPFILKGISPTLNFEAGDVSKVPIQGIAHSGLLELAGWLIEICKNDWNSYETSWDFIVLPLLKHNYRQQTLKATYQVLCTHWREMTLKMQRLEEENNRIFIDAYGLQDELTPEVPLNEITLTCNPHYRYGNDKSEDELEALLLADTMREFVSYAVGCMFGRYSLDKPGLILANQGETLADYLAQVPRPSFPVDDDNVIPLLDGDWFTDDITDRFRQFLRLTFGEEHYEDNLQFLEQGLNVKGKRNYGIRDYFLGEFYADHVKRYKKRPIYWLFSSPKGSFNALIYLHRYRPDTVSVVLRYLRDFRDKLAARLRHLQQVVVGSAASQGEKTRANKEIEGLKKQILELEDYERDTLYPLATEQIALDLDDGVKVNYLKLGPALKKIPGLEAKGED